MTDYQGNAKRLREGSVPEKSLEKVVKGEVVIQKKSLGAKIKDLFVAADFSTVVKYVGTDVLLPAARNMIVDASTKGIERMMYGERAIRHRNYGMGPRITYNSPINRGEWRDPSTRPPSPSITRVPRRGQSDYIISQKEDADAVLERMNDIVDQWQVATVADLHELLGLASSHVDHKWGWMFLGDVQVRPIREGFVLDFPPAEPIQ